MVAIILDLLIGYGRWVQDARGSRGSRAPAQAAGAHTPAVFTRVVHLATKTLSARAGQPRPRG